MEFLTWLQDHPISVWIVETETIWGYPTVLALHTFGLAILCGANAVVNLRLLGFIPSAPLPALEKLFGPMWFGLALNTITGVLLWAASARVKTFVIMFWVKIAFIVFAVVVLVRIRRVVRDWIAAPEMIIPPGASRLVALSLFFWSGAIIAGRLMAYLKWEWRFLGE